jgi:hypothetical protein
VEVVIREMTEENAMRLRKHRLTTSTVKLTLAILNIPLNQDLVIKWQLKQQILRKN